MYMYPGNVLEAFLEVRLYSCRVLCLRKDLQQLVVREEVEPWERCSLCLEVLAESLLDLVQEFVAFP